MLTAEELDRLEAVARAATPGPWHSVPSFWADSLDREEGPGIFAVENAAGMVICDRRTPWPEKADEMQANASHIAACDPATILALVEMARKALGDSNA